MYAASGMRNTIAIATVIVQPAAMRTTASPRPSLGASSCARNARNGVRCSMRLARTAAASDHTGQQERSGVRQHVPGGARAGAAALSIEHIHTGILHEAAGAKEPPFGGGMGCRNAGMESAG